MKFLFFLLAVTSAGAQTPDTEWGRVRAYFSAGVVFSRDNASFSKQTPYAGFNLDKNWRSGRVLLINTFFETQLTSIPVGTGVTGFAGSEKAARAAAGLYAPLLTTRWTFNGQDHALFVAPLAVAGFETPTAAGADRFYSSSGGGVRVGHFHMPAQAGAAPELVSWLDIVYGRFGSLDPHRRRLEVEGTLRAPGTPLVVGFSANLGAAGSARDDLRLFLGTRFDLGSLIAKLRD